MRRLVFLFIFFIPLFSFSQIFVATGQKAVDYKEALVADIIVKALPEDTITNWLNNCYAMAIRCYTDTSGFLRNIDRIKFKKKEISRSLLLQLQDYWIKSGLRIPTVYSDDGMSSEYAIKLGIDDIRNGAMLGVDSIAHFIGFPPELYRYYIFSEPELHEPRLKFLKDIIKTNLEKGFE